MVAACGGGDRGGRRHRSFTPSPPPRGTIGMSFHPNEVARRSRAAAILATAVLFVLCSAFFRTQILGHKQWVLQSEENRLREVPIAAPRGVIFDRNGKIIAENVGGYAAGDIEEARRHDSSYSESGRARSPALQEGAYTARGDPERRLLRRRVGAGGAPRRFSEPHHHVVAQAVLSRGLCGAAVRRL